MKTWILSIVAVTILSFSSKILIPDGKTKQILSFIISLVSVIIIVSPLKNIDNIQNMDIPEIELDEKFTNFYNECINDYYLSLSKSKLKCNGIELKKADFIFKNADDHYKIQNIKINLKDVVIIDNNQHINITSKVKKLLSELFSIKANDVIIEN